MEALFLRASRESSSPFFLAGRENDAAARTAFSQAQLEGGLRELYGVVFLAGRENDAAARITFSQAPLKRGLRELYGALFLR